MAVRDYLRAHPFYFVAAIFVAVVLALVGLWILIGIIKPLPPPTVTMATGPPGGAYHQYGERYRKFFARKGIELRLLPTDGAMDNLDKLNDPHSGVSVGFLQGGTTNVKSSPDLESLGTIFYEPLWFFCRDACKTRGFEGLRGRRISIGPEGSGTRFLMLKLFARMRITENFAELLSYSFQTSAEKLLNGEIDAAFILSSWESPVVRRLLAAEHIDLVNFPHAEALVALDPFLTKLVVPAGVGEIAQNRPPKDTVVLASKASLVVRSGLHPAIQYLLLDAADKIHSGSGIFQKGGQFPAAESVDLPLSEEARRFYRSGQPFLQRYLPFWLAVLIVRLLVVLIPVVGIVYPLARITPVLYGWKMHRRVFKLYSELRAVEHAMESPVAENAKDLLARLNLLEEKADHLWVPISAMGELYLFKQHLALVRSRLETREEAGEADSADRRNEVHRPDADPPGGGCKS